MLVFSSRYWRTGSISTTSERLRVISICQRPIEYLSNRFGQLLVARFNLCGIMRALVTRCTSKANEHSSESSNETKISAFMPCQVTQSAYNTPPPNHEGSGKSSLKSRD